MIDEDELYRLKMGRFSDADERLAKTLFRSKKRHPTGLSGRALSWRTRHAGSGWRLNDGPQVVVKAAGSRKSLSGVRACVRYVARLRCTDTQPARAFDEFGRELPPDAVLKVVETWQLARDADNLSPAAREGREGLGERQRLRHVQAWHFVFSIKVEEDDAAVEPLVRAANAAIDASFTRLGHRVLWALHTDRPGRPHVHVVVKAVSDLGGRLRCDKHGDLFDTLRSEFASALFMAGLRYQAARREDRSDVRERVMTGQEPLRTGRPTGRGDGDLVRRAPAWFLRFGREYTERMSQVGQEAPPSSRWWHWWRRRAARSEPLTVPAQYTAVHAAFTQIYRDPTHALVAWQRLAVEGAHRRPNGQAVFPTRRLAEWYARHRPEALGELLPGTMPDDRLRTILRAVPLPVPAPTPVPRLDAALVHEFHHIRWRRRVERDRRWVAGSLTRLAGIALRRTGDEWLARGLLRRVDAALRLPIGALPVVRPAPVPSPQALVRDTASPPPSPAAAMTATTPVPPAIGPVRQPRPRRTGRGSVER